MDCNKHTEKKRANTRTTMSKLICVYKWQFRCYGNQKKAKRKQKQTKVIKKIPIYFNAAPTPCRKIKKKDEHTKMLAYVLLEVFTKLISFHTNILCAFTTPTKPCIPKKNTPI